MKIEKKYILESPFWQNYFCLIPNSNVAFLSISKNASSFLKTTAIFNATQKWVQDADIPDVHNLIGFDPEKSPYLFKYEDLSQKKKENPELITFAVWRDPVDRFISTYKLFFLEREFRNYFNWMGFYNRSVSFKEFLKFAEFELSKPDPAFQDEHIRRQTAYIESTDDIDFIVHMKDVYRFLDEHKVQYIREKSNQTNSNFEKINSADIAKIKKLYKEDYSIKTNF
ncbi:sulfotransferase family 2 domain-containing protein [Sphingobacterium siyangense]|jgi:hypothetical protein|uniref:sulfotransferase family 2 domain-containing protein n=1 Tax=Sphingobacterium siyangense TaxID=459529 RepID=UPI0028AB8F80|nr:sulfotransferase family 2 domain-containing protein [Sphingobacterium siyangense]